MLHDNRRIENIKWSLLIFSYSCYLSICIQGCVVIEDGGSYKIEPVALVQFLAVGSVIAGSMVVGNMAVGNVVVGNVVVGNVAVCPSVTGHVAF